MDIIINENMIAPCGMNCSLCYAHQREKNQCLGCRVDSPNKRKSCTKCSIVLCESRDDVADFCFTCNDKVCSKLKRLDKTYREKYKMSMFENLEIIKKKGIEAFIDYEKSRWACEKCGSLICVHDGKCKNCSE